MKKIIKFKFKNLIAMLGEDEKEREAKAKAEALKDYAVSCHRLADDTNRYIERNGWFIGKVGNHALLKMLNEIKMDAIEEHNKALKRLEEEGRVF